MTARVAALVMAACAACSSGAFVLDRPDAAPARVDHHDYCTELPSLTRAPVLDDGRVDDSLPLADVPTTSWEAIDAQPLPAGHGARVAAAWRPDALYVFVDVTDPDRVAAAENEPVWWGDAVEIYVDHDGALAAPPAYDDPGTRHLLFGAPADAVAPLTRVERTSAADALSKPWTGTLAVARPRPGGYVVEVLVRAADLDLAGWTLTAGSRIGFDLSVDVSYPTRTAGLYGSRMGSFVLRADPASAIPESFPFHTSRAFCLPTLLPP